MTQVAYGYDSDANLASVAYPDDTLRFGYDRDGLIEMYLRTIDWSLERNFPSLRLLRREFSDIEDKGVFVGKTFDG